MMLAVKDEKETHFKNTKGKRVKYANKTIKFYNALNFMLHLVGMPGFWVQDVKLLTALLKDSKILKIIDVVLGLTAVMIFLSLFLQNNLSSDQRFIKQIGSFPIPTSYCYCLILLLRRNEIRDILYQLAVTSKELHRDEEIEQHMIISIITCSLSYTVIIVVTLIRGGISMIGNYLQGEPAISILTVWPDIGDVSPLAQIVRFIIYGIWWLLGLRTTVALKLIFTVIVGISHEFQYIQSYFYSLDNIFKRNISQDEKDREYIKAYTRGIKFHIEALRCTRQCQYACGIVFNIQFLILTQVMVPVIYNMIVEKNNPQNISIAIGGLASCSLFWCMAGNIKVEAFKVANAMYCSGWNHCSGKNTVSLRKMVVISMMQAQQPVVLQSFRHIELTYETFVKFLKSAYVAFIMFY